jgi:hypothetical protein
MKKNQNALIVYLFEDTYNLYKYGLIGNKFILNVLREMKEQGETFTPIRRKDFPDVKRKLGEGGNAYIVFPPDLHEWYADIYENTKRGLWVKLHHKLLDKLSKICYNIHNFKKEVQS